MSKGTKPADQGSGHLRPRRQISESTDDLSNRVQHPASAINLPDQVLRRVLLRLDACEDVVGSADWEVVGEQLLSLAERDAHEWRTHASEYISAYVTEVITLFRRQPGVLARVPRPWGVAVTNGRIAGRYAVGLEALVGLTGRDDVSHRIRPSSAPPVVSLESLAELDE